ncbi:MAG: hypothetical protein ACR2LV_00755 [Solirubrobacteraceae bacterium]
MSNHDHPSAISEPSADDLGGLWQRVVGRRSFLKGVAGAAALPAAGILGAGPALAADSRPTKGDIAILRFLAAVHR